MKKTIKKSILYTMKLQKKAKWFIEYKGVKTKYPILQANDVHLLASKKVLMLIPHADDELIGGSQLIKVFGSNLKAFYFGFLGPIPPKNSAQIRLSELKKSSEKLMLKFYASTGNHSNELTEVIRDMKPEIIALPFLIDWQPEHLESGKILDQALQKTQQDFPSYHPQICMYQISVPITEEFITHYLPMSKVDHTLKWRLFNDVYSSQNYIPAPRFMLQERLSGQFLGYYAAEVFTLTSYSDWRVCLSKVVEYDIKNFYLDKKIGNIKKIRLASQYLSKEFLT
ncbi:hypothetical protein QWY22_14865 [Planococcus liqunii]|uniref:PIG-L family deacetylase n=1 Tax=Planococcus liqunii TaxID=3058394 RepID=A0ABT8MND3_9BACL|nr:MULTISPECIES: hypothetical protein [unclassified Planococcus (in: firmicutes)]MDN7226397.1 hypothetical protein [Planococcus sp. N064]WKA50170.1 hypothetical protein QWY22_14865 [Planococcus sp. N056]